MFKILNSNRFLKVSAKWVSAMTGRLIPACSRQHIWALKYGNNPKFAKIRLRRLRVCAAAMNRTTLMCAAAMNRTTRNSGADAIGPFAPRLRLWDGCPAVLVNTKRQRFAAVAMDLADFSAREIFDTLGIRFRAENYNDPQKNLCLLRILRSLLTGCLKVIHYMHLAGLAHCDFKPDKMLMKKLDATPPRDSPWHGAKCSARCIWSHYKTFAKSGPRVKIWPSRFGSQQANLKIKLN
jgi:hypothetical protein